MICRPPRDFLIVSLNYFESVWVWYFWVFLDVIGLESINWAFYWGDREPWGTFGLRSRMTLILLSSSGDHDPNHPQKKMDRDLEAWGSLRNIKKDFTKKWSWFFSIPWQQDQPSSIASSPSPFPNWFLAVLWWWWWWYSGEGYWLWSNDSVILHQLIDYTLSGNETAALVGGRGLLCVKFDHRTCASSLFTDVHWKKRQRRKHPLLDFRLLMWAIAPHVFVFGIL